MHKIDGAGNVNGTWVTEDVALLRPPTEITADIMNALQSEIVNVIEGAGFTLNKPTNTQLLSAIQAMIKGGDYKDSVRFTTTANIVLTGLGTQAGGDWPAALTAADRILVKNQGGVAAHIDNGYYTAAPGAWTRATDADTGAELNSGAIIPVESGTLNADTNWQLTTDGTVVIGTTALIFVDQRFIGAGYMLLRDEKATNTDAGASVAGLQTRVLNTVGLNTIVGASLATNQFTLPAGNYRINASAPAFGVNGHTAFLRNVTDTTTVIVGTAENTSSNTNSTVDPIQTRSHIAGKFTIATAKVFDIRHDCIEAVAGNGLGRVGGTVGGLASIYTIVEIFKES